MGAKLPQYFKERNQITTPSVIRYVLDLCEVTTIFQRTKSNHNIINQLLYQRVVRSYHNISKNEIKSQLQNTLNLISRCAKLPQYFKERNQITTGYVSLFNFKWCEVTTIFQRTKSNHNSLYFTPLVGNVRSYHNISKNEIKSQLISIVTHFLKCAKLPQYFKERNQITTEQVQLLIVYSCEVTTIFQRTKSNHNQSLIRN